ncbi:MAG: putative membrane protein YfhO, partial [Gammaproteobacteria bacterium]
TQQLLLINESYLPRWRATVNGQDVPVLRANARFMAVPLPKGEFRAIVTFSVDSWRSGLAVSTLGVGAIAALLIFGWRRNLNRQRTHRSNISAK